MLLFSLLFILCFNPSVFINAEVCASKCAEKFKDEKELSSCNDGCRLAVVFNFAAGNQPEVVSNKCRDGCKESYQEDKMANACVLGCDSQPPFTGGNMEITFDSSDPVFKVASNAIHDMFPHNLFPQLTHGRVNNEGLSSSSEENDSTEWFDEMRRRMQYQMGRFHQLMMQNFMNLDTKAHPVALVAVERPHGHHMMTGIGPVLGNLGNDGMPIISVHPFDGSMPSVDSRLGQPQHQELGWWSRLAARARRLSMLSQWLVYAALLLCLIAMVAISIAILKQIKVQRYQNLQNVRVIAPSTFGVALEAKKVPLTDEAPKNDYPLIHDSPPPAYDQLSVHKAEQSDGKDSA